ncbi:MAG: hypothetical protein ACUVWB_07640, partial [Anaerolineae bacterium]
MRGTYRKLAYVGVAILLAGILGGCQLSPAGLIASLARRMESTVPSAGAGTIAEKVGAAPAEGGRTEQTPSAQTMPTPAPLSAQAMNAFLSGPRAFGAEPFCLQLTDTDGDGEREWLGLFELVPLGGSGVAGFVLDGSQMYPLGQSADAQPPTDPSSWTLLSELPACQVQVQDVTGDGLVEILVYGASQADQHQLSIFSWNRHDAYPLVASFGGAAGVALEDLEQDGLPEVVTMQYLWEGVILREISRWDGVAYRFDRSVYAAAPEAVGPLPADTPEQSLVAYYLNLSRRDYRAAYDLLSAELHSRQDYKAFLLSAAGVRSLQLGELSSPAQE